MYSKYMWWIPQGWLRTSTNYWTKRRDRRLSASGSNSSRCADGVPPLCHNCTRKGV